MSLISILKYKIRCTWKSQVQKQAMNKVRRNILSYYSSHPTTDEEIAEATSYLQTHPLCTFPAAFTQEYDPARIGVLRDPENGLLYVVHQGKKLYFKRSYNERTVRNIYCGLIVEQDTRSPHCYTSNQFTIDTNDILFDIGSAEGIIPLTHIEKIKEVVLFEKDKEWLEALEATFAPWKEKVTIIARYVSNRDDNDFISIDCFLSHYSQHPTFIKIDVEGAESSVLKGMKHLLETTHSLKIALCTYHQAQDFEQFTHQFLEQDAQVEPSSGVMLFLNDLKEIQSPYFRKGLLRITTK